MVLWREKILNVPWGDARRRSSFTSAVYQDILETMNLTPEECLMVGNDVDEDMIAETLGMKVFLLTDCLLNRKNKDITRYPQGSFPELLEYIRTL